MITRYVMLHLLEQTVWYILVHMWLTSLFSQANEDHFVAHQILRLTFGFDAVLNVGVGGITPGDTDGQCADNKVVFTTEI
jgi:hypothetical protein